ncbi:MAG: hypothetical protein JW774_00110 [Candidatus Aureabacteria bacterium]|nr:hypothetical protein [Candidatus Auribacterota bacterium]
MGRDLITIGVDMGGTSIETIHDALESEKSDVFDKETWKSAGELPAFVRNEIESLESKKEAFRLLKERDNSFLLITEKGFKIIGHYVRKDGEWMNLIYKYGVDTLIPFGNRWMLDEHGFIDFLGRKIPFFDKQGKPIGRDLVTDNGDVMVDGRIRKTIRHGFICKLVPKEIRPLICRDTAETGITALYRMKEIMDRMGLMRLAASDENVYAFYKFYRDMTFTLTYKRKDGVCDREMAAYNAGSHSVPVVFCFHDWLNTALTMASKGRRSEVTVMIPE